MSGACPWRHRADNRAAGASREPGFEKDPGSWSEVLTITIPLRVSRRREREQSHVGRLANKLDAFRTVITADSSHTTWQLHPKTQAQQAIHNHRSCNGQVPELQRANPSGPS